MSNLVYTTPFWYNLHLMRSMAKIGNLII